MRHWIAMFVAGVIAAVTFTGLVQEVSPQPAQASVLCSDGHICGDFYHISPDDGFDDAIKVTCDWNVLGANSQWVYEGQHSTCHDADGFYVAPGHIVKCRFISGRGFVTWVSYGPGWNKFGDPYNMACVHQLA